MKYITTSEIEIKYNVSRPTISKWIEDAVNKENGLQVIRVNSSVKIIDNPFNHEVLKSLSNTASKFKPKTERKTTKPRNEFYQLYDLEQISNIYLGLEYRREINLKYVYRGKGQEYWDNYYKSEQNTIKLKVEELLMRSRTDLENFTRENSKVNVIDLGPGNAEPIKPVIKFLTESKKLNKYISVDNSDEINQDSLNNIGSSFPQIELKSYNRDLETSHFSDIFLSNKVINKNESNLVFMLGSTINNSDDRLTILKNISASLTKEDYLFISYTTDSPLNRAKVSYVNEGPLAVLWEWLFLLMGFDFNVKCLEGNYDNVYNRNELSFVSDKDYLLNFNLGEQVLPLKVYKNEKLICWKHYLINIRDFMDDFAKSNLQLVDYKLDATGTHGLVVLRVA